MLNNVCACTCTSSVESSAYGGWYAGGPSWSFFSLCLHDTYTPRHPTQNVEYDGLARFCAEAGSTVSPSRYKPLSHHSHSSQRYQPAEQ
eukprot:scaffold10631_cov98-Isochrysis_galbana.AAC.2